MGWDLRSAAWLGSLDVRLDEVAAGAFVVVRAIDGADSSGADAAVARRLEALGFIPGTRVEVGRRAPLGDPTVYRVRGSDIAVRRDTARLISVELLNPGGTS